ncbi:sigma factor [Streptomyces niveus]|uniref:sigma factor n=1 Tax=Streptomyces niveus TaxID=193462 RepID=UPI0038635AF1
MSRIEVTDELIREAQAGNGDAMWEIVSAYEPMLKAAIRSVAPSAGQDDTEGLLQEARATLIQHVRDYDTEASAASLYTYAHRAVRRAVAEEWLNATTSLTVEASTALTVKRALWEAGGDVEGAWLAVSSATDAKRRLSWEVFTSVIEALADVACLDEGVKVRSGDSQVGHATLADTIPDASSDFTDPVERRELARYLLSQIPSRQSLALRAFYGIGMSQSPDAETAADMAVTLAALRKLRSNGVISARAAAHTHDLAA